MTKDSNNSEPSFQIDRFRCKDLNEPDYLMFNECVKQLDSFKPNMFRLESHQKAWKCQFANEHAQDAGGPYRESIEWMCSEIKDPNRLPLFVLCPNGKENIGKNDDKYVPNPLFCTKKHEKMYHFLGKLMGLSIRTGDLLSLNLAPIVWKRILNQSIKSNDITNIEKSCFSIFDTLNKFINLIKKKYKTTEEETEKNVQLNIFNTIMEKLSCKFEGKSSDKNIYPLIPNGEFISITHKNLNLFKNCYYKYRLTEYDFACDSIRRGLSTVIPINYLNLFTYKILEEKICGNTKFNVDLLQEMTTYSCCNENDKHIQLFWEMFRNKMNDEERSKFLIFVWGRSKLPINKEKFEKKMSIVLLDYPNPDNYLPVSHTCFFQLDLPAYSNLDMMYRKVCYAITNCGSIDTDE